LDVTGAQIAGASAFAPVSRGSWRRSSYSTRP